MNNPILVKAMDDLLRGLDPDDTDIANAFERMARELIYELDKKNQGQSASFPDDKRTYYLTTDADLVILSAMNTTLMPLGFRTALALAKESRAKEKRAVIIRDWEWDIPVRRIP